MGKPTHTPACIPAGDTLLTLLHCCCCTPAAVALLLLHCCCCATAVALLIFHTPPHTSAAPWPCRVSPLPPTLLHAGNVRLQLQGEQSQLLSESDWRALASGLPPLEVGLLPCGMWMSKRHLCGALL